MKLQDKLVNLEIHTQVLVIAYNLENDEDYSKKDAIDELTRLSNQLADQFVNKEVKHAPHSP